MEAQFLADRERSPFEAAYALRRRRFQRFGNEPRLPKACVAHQAHDSAPAGGDPGHGRPDLIQLLYTPDELREHGAIGPQCTSRVGVLLYRKQLEHLDPLAVLDINLESLVFELAARVAVRIGPHPDLPRGILVFEAGSQDHGLARDVSSTCDGAADFASHQEPRVDPDVDAQRHGWVQLLVERGHAVAHLDGGIDGRPGGVLECRRRAEGGHDAIADVLVGRAAVAEDKRLEEGEAAVHDRSQVLGIHQLRDFLVAREIGEENRRVSSLAVHGLPARSGALNGRAARGSSSPSGKLTSLPR